LSPLQLDSVNEDALLVDTELWRFSERLRVVSSDGKGFGRS
jgi:hypothetical protein